MVQNIIATLLESKIVKLKNKPKRLESNYQFNQDDMMVEIGSYFTNESERSYGNDLDNNTTNSTKRNTTMS